MLPVRYYIVHNIYKILFSDVVTRMFILYGKH
jgi:hypothetical protein